MKRVIDKANHLNGKFGSDLDKITDSLGLSVMYEDMAGRMKEFYFRGSIVIRSDLSLREKRELIAHALGHHLFHAGCQVTPRFPKLSDSNSPAPGV